MGILESPWRYAPNEQLNNANAIEFGRQSDALQLQFDTEQRDQFITYARQRAKDYGVDPDIFQAQIGQESGFNPNAYNQKSGATGIAQIMPQFHPSVNPKDPFASLDYSAKLMGGYLKQYNGDYELALAAYNAGPGNVAQAGGVPDFPETKTYIANILGSRQDIKRASQFQAVSKAEPPPFYQHSDEAGPIAAANFQEERNRRSPLDITNIATNTMQKLLGIQSAYAEDFSPHEPISPWDLPTKPLTNEQMRSVHGFGSLDPNALASGLTAAPFGAPLGLPGIAGAFLVGAAASKLPIPSGVTLGQVVYDAWQTVNETVGQPFVGATLERADRSILSQNLRKMGDIVNDVYLGPLKDMPGLGWLYTTNKFIRNEVANYASWLDPIIPATSTIELAQKALAGGQTNPDYLRETYDRWQKKGAQYEKDNPWGYMLLSFGNPVFLADWGAPARLVKSVPSAVREAIHTAATKSTFNLFEPSDAGLVRDGLSDGINAWENLARVAGEPGSGITEADLLGGITNGTLQPEVVNAAFDTNRMFGLRWKDALEELTKAAQDEKFRPMFDNLMEHLPVLESEQIGAGLAGILQKYRAKTLGVTPPPVAGLGGRVYDAYMSLWRSTVLRTPKWVTQQWVEDPVRLVLNGYWPVLTHLDSYAQRYPWLPVEIKNMGVTWKERLQGIRKVSEKTPGESANQMMSTIQDQMLNQTNPALMNDLAPLTSWVPGNIKAAWERGINGITAAGDVMDVGSVYAITVQATERMLRRLQERSPEIRSYLDRLAYIKEELKARLPSNIHPSEVDDFILGSEASVTPEEIDALVANKASDPFRAARLGPPSARGLPLVAQEGIRDSLKTANTPEQVNAIFQKADEQWHKYLPEASADYAKQAEAASKSAIVDELSPENRNALTPVAEMWAQMFVDGKSLAELSDDAVAAGSNPAFERELMMTRALEMGYGSTALSEIMNDADKTISIIRAAGFAPGPDKITQAVQLHAAMAQMIKPVYDEARSRFEKFRGYTHALSKKMAAGDVSQDAWNEYIANVSRDADPGLVSNLVNATPSKDTLWNNYFPMRRAWHQGNILQGVVQFVNDNFLHLDTATLNQKMPLPPQFIDNWKAASAEWKQAMLDAITHPESGQIRLYHGTPTAFEKFDPTTSNEGLFGNGIYLTDSPAIAGKYSLAKGAEVSIRDVNSWQEEVDRTKSILLAPSEEQLSFLKERGISVGSTSQILPELKSHLVFAENQLEGFLGQVRPSNIRPVYLDPETKIVDIEDLFPESDKRYLLVGYNPNAQEVARQQGYEGIRYRGGLMTHGEAHNAYVIFPEAANKIVPFTEVEAKRAAERIGAFWFDAGVEAKKHLSGMSQEVALQQVAMRNSAVQFGMDEANRVMHVASRELNIDRIMRPIAPFWFFPSRAYPFYVETVLKKPWTLNTLYQYFEANTGDPITDPRRLRGLGVSAAELPVIGAELKKAGVDFRLNPALFMGMYQFFAPRPVYNQNDSNLQRLLDLTGQGGISPAPIPSLAAQVVSKQLTDIFHLPPQLQPLLRDLYPQEQFIRPLTSMAMAMAHLDEATHRAGPSISDLFSPLVQPEPAPFFEYNVNKELQGLISNQIVQKELELGRKLTPMERDQLETALFNSKDQREKAAMIVNQMDLARAIVGGKPVFTGELENRKTVSDFIQNQLGVSQADLEKDIENGTPIIWRLNREQQRELFRQQPQLAGTQRTIPPEVDPRYRRVYVATANFWTQVAVARRDLLNSLTPLAEQVANGKLAGAAYRDQRSDLFTKYRNTFDALRQNNPEAIITTEQKASFRQLMGQDIQSAHLEDLALEQYWQISPDKFKKADGSTDWRSYFAAKQAFALNQPEPIRKYIENYESSWRDDLRQNNPKAAQVEDALQQAQLDYQKYQTIPKYLGYTVEQGEIIDQLLTNVADWRQALPPLVRSTDLALAMMNRKNPQLASRAQKAVLIAQYYRNRQRTEFFNRSVPLRLFFSDTAGEDWPVALRPTIEQILARQ